MEGYGGLSYAAVKDASDIRHLRQISQKRRHVRQFRVVWIIEPGRHGDRVIGMEYIGRRRVIQYNRVPYRPSKLTKVLDPMSALETRSVQTAHLYIISFVKVAALTEQTMCNNFMDVQLVQHGVRILVLTSMM